MESSLNAILFDTNVSNFVSVKLSGPHNYTLWKAQMCCLLDSNNVLHIVDDTFAEQRDSGIFTMRQYNSLVKGWILGSVTEDVLINIVHLDSARDVWLKLELIYGFPRYLQEDSISDSSADTIEIIADEDIEHKNKLQALKLATIKGDWSKVESILRMDRGLVTEAISSDGTILHIAVGTGHKDFVKNLIRFIDTKQVLQQRDSDGSTALHVAAIVGNKDAAELLVKKNNTLLEIKDNGYDDPLQKACENMCFDTIEYLLEAVEGGGAPWQSFSDHLDDEIGVRLLVNAISAKQYSLASKLVQYFPSTASGRDDALMAIAKNFPSGLDYGETLVYPPLENMVEMLGTVARATLYLFVFPLIILYDFTTSRNETDNGVCWMFITIVIVTVPSVLASAFAFICLLILVVCFIFVLIYFIWWKGAKILVPPIKKIENKIKELDEAKKVLKLVCDEIDKMRYSDSRHPFYRRPLIEAACHNAYVVVDEILSRSPESIHSTDKNGYDIIQLAITHRSEKIYNLIYDFRERKNSYRTFVDSFGNNILHLAGKLAPSSVLNQRAGAALQLQRELQWHEEVKQLVIPEFITKENTNNDTPDMVFTREHKNLVKEAEQWMKTTAKSCSITAALITTIVFAAAITVPGGSSQVKGTPLFKKEIAFIIFAISDAISLFASSTGLLVFLSILTARFSQRDFLVSLPMRMLIGLFSLLFSTTAMMVAFSATLFLVFCNEKLWMLGPICGLAIIPIAFFVRLQFPLMLDLFSSTSSRISGKQKKNILNRFNLSDIRLRFRKRN